MIADFHDEFPQLSVQAYRKPVEGDNPQLESLGQCSFSLSEELLDFEQLLGVQPSGSNGSVPTSESGYSVRAMFYTPKGNISIPCYNGSAWILIEIEDADDIPPEADDDIGEELPDGESVDDDTPSLSPLSPQDPMPPERVATPAREETPVVHEPPTPIQEVHAQCNDES